MADYTDFGPPSIVQRIGTRRTAPNIHWTHRPFCDICGPFRGRELRRAGSDEFGPVWICRKCDEELDYRMAQ